MELHEIPAEQIRSAMLMAEDMTAQDGSTHAIITLGGVRYHIDVLEAAVVVDAEAIA